MSLLSSQQVYLNMPILWWTKWIRMDTVLWDYSGSIARIWMVYLLKTCQKLVELQMMLSFLITPHLPTCFSQNKPCQLYRGMTIQRIDSYMIWSHFWYNYQESMILDRLLLSSLKIIKLNLILQSQFVTKFYRNRRDWNKSKCSNKCKCNKNYKNNRNKQRNNNNYRLLMQNNKKNSNRINRGLQ